MKKGLPPVIGLFFLFCCFATPLAASDIGFGAASFSKDTFQFGDTLFITTSIINYDTAAYYDLVDLGLIINGVENANRNIVITNPLSDQLLSLPPGDSISLKIELIITPSYYEVGPDIFVVWPICINGSPPHDSLTKQIYVLDPTGISSLQAKPTRVFYYDQAIIIEDIGDDNAFKRVRIFNSVGQVLINSPWKQNGSIPFANYADGIYFLELGSASGKMEVFRISKF